MPCYAIICYAYPVVFTMSIVSVVHIIRCKTLPFPQIQNANRQKTVSISDFTEDELKRLNATIQLDWKLFEALGNMDRSW